MGKCGQGAFKSAFGLGEGGAAGGDICGDPQIDSALVDESSANDEIDTAASQRNRAREAAQLSACAFGQMRKGPLQVGPGQKVDVTGHGVR